MAQRAPTSDLIDLVHHEHDHLCKLFEDIGQTFEKIADGQLEGERQVEVLETASDDLEMALEEMLHHFNQEEEVFFVAITDRFPELSQKVEGLAQTHELMCDRTRWLHRQLGMPQETILGKVDEIMKVVNQMRQLLSEHTANENRLFDSALKQMPAEERDSLLQEMRRL